MQKLFTLFTAVLIFNVALGQSDTLEMLNNNEPITKQKVKLKTFNSTRIINGHSVEFLPKGFLDFRILHRFGSVKNGWSDLFGLDYASMRMGLDYGISNNTTIGVGRSTNRKELDIYLKQKLLNYRIGLNPIKIFALAGATRTTGFVFADNGTQIIGGERTAYFFQIGAGTLINKKFGFQLTPTLVSMNLVENIKNDKSIFSLGIGANYKVSKHLSLVVDYFTNLSGLETSIYKNPFSFGVDIETGGHTFQLHFSNTYGMNEKAFITQTKDKWAKGEFKFGFNLSRLFQVAK